MDKSYVTLVVCPICQKDSGELLLDRRLKERFEMRTLTPKPCEKCRKKYLVKQKGIMLLNPETYDVVILKESAFKRAFNVPVPQERIAFVTDEVMQRLCPTKNKK